MAKKLDLLLELGYSLFWFFTLRIHLWSFR